MRPNALVAKQVPNMGEKFLNQGLLLSLLSRPFQEMSTAQSEEGCSLTLREYFLRGLG